MVTLSAASKGLSLSALFQMKSGKFDIGYGHMVEWDIRRKGAPMEMAKDSEAKKRWDKENTVMVSIKFQNKTDGDIIAFLRDTENEEQKITKQSIIKQALREYIANHKEET